MDGEKILDREESFTKFGCYLDDEGSFHWPDGRINHAGRCINEIWNGCTGRRYDIGPYCRKCEREYDEECENERKKEQFERLCAEYESMGLLPRHFSLYKAPGLYAWQSNALNDINSDYGRNVWLTAEHGNGKTEVGKVALWNALRNAVTAAYVDCAGTGLSDMARNHNARHGAARARLLVLDDLSKMLVTDYSAGELHSLLSERHQGKLRTIVLSERKGNDFAAAMSAKTEKRFGASTVDRLSWKGAPVMAIEMHGENIRRK
jgi:DNA replication protein DnaC